jgi:hypothetical protein
MIDPGLGDLGPLMKIGVGTDHLRHRLQGKTALGLHGLQGLEILEVAIGWCFIGQWPQALRRGRAVHPDRVVADTRGRPSWGGDARIACPNGTCSINDG